MKNSSKFWRKLLIITSIFVGSLVVAVLILWKNADSLLTNLADRKLKEFIARSDSFSLSYSRLDLNLAKGTVRLNDIATSLQKHWLKMCNHRTCLHSTDYTKLLQEASQVL